MGRRVLVTGGAGFIGAHLVRRLLAAGETVAVLDDLSSGRRENVPAGAQLIEGSVTDPDGTAKALEGVEACFHLAAIASIETCRLELLASHRVNAYGFMTVLDALRRRGGLCALVYASSAAVYGGLETLPHRENGPVEPLSAYAADKYGCELHAIAAWRAYGLGAVGLRFFNVYGPGQDPSSPYSGVISRFLDRAARGEPLTIFGDGGQTRDFVHVDEVVEALVRVGAAPVEGAPVYNVCTGRQVSVADLAKIVVEASTTGSTIQNAPPRLGEVRHSLGAPDALERAVGFRPQTSFAEGFKGLLAS